MTFIRTLDATKTGVLLPTENKIKSILYQGSMRWPVLAGTSREDADREADPGI